MKLKPIKTSVGIKDLGNTYNLFLHPVTTYEYKLWCKPQQLQGKYDIAGL